MNLWKVLCLWYREKIATVIIGHFFLGSSDKFEKMTKLPSIYHFLKRFLKEQILNYIFGLVKIREQLNILK